MASALAWTTGELRSGKLLVRSWERFVKGFARRKDGPVIIRVERADAPQSAQARKYLWGLVYPTMVAETGHTEEELHYEMCRRFLTHTVTLVNKRTGEVEESQLPGRSSRLSNDEYCDFINRVIQFAGEFLQMEIPEADPNWRTKKDTKAA